MPQQNRKVKKFLFFWCWMFSWGLMAFPVGWTSFMDPDPHWNHCGSTTLQWKSFIFLKIFLVWSRYTKSTLKWRVAILFFYIIKVHPHPELRVAKNSNLFRCCFKQAFSLAGADIPVFPYTTFSFPLGLDLEPSGKKIGSGSETRIFYTTFFIGPLAKSWSLKHNKRPLLKRWIVLTHVTRLYFNLFFLYIQIVKICVHLARMSTRASARRQHRRLKARTPRGWDTSLPLFPVFSNFSAWRQHNLPMLPT